MLEWLWTEKRFTEVEAFEDYTRLVEQAGNSPPDFCIIRLGRDEIPGLKIAETVKQISPDVRIIFISDERNFALAAYELGAHGYLLCPLVKDKFQSCLKHTV